MFIAPLNEYPNNFVPFLYATCACLIMKYARPKTMPIWADKITIVLKSNEVSKNILLRLAYK